MMLAAGVLAPDDRRFSVFIGGDNCSPVLYHQNRQEQKCTSIADMRCNAC